MNTPMPLRSITEPATPGRFTGAVRKPLFLALLCTLAATGLTMSAAAETRAVHNIFVAPPHGGKLDALDQRIAAKLRQSGDMRLVDSQQLADAVLHVDAVFWPIGSMTLNPRSNSGSFTSYAGYASADLAAPSGQVLWSYLATPLRFKLTGIVDNLADQISERLIATVKAGMAAAPLGASVPGARGAALRAAGATFPAPLYQRWFQSFAEQPGGLAISYEAVGSVKGIDLLAAGNIEMAASDIPPPAASTAPAFDANLIRLPSVVGGIVPIYNLSGNGQKSIEQIDLTGDVLADIYSGKVTRWNDPRIRALNKAAHLPDAAIAVIHRSDGSGTTFVWTSYLALSNSDWKNRVGATIDWPIGAGMVGNGGVADAVVKTPNSIGYVELTFAIQHHLSYAGVRNPAGRTIRASLDSITAAAESVFGARAHAGGVLSNSPGLLLNSKDKDAYPITTFTWLVIPGAILKASFDPQKRASIKRFLQWMLVDGQRQCSELGYAPLPRDLVRQEQRTVDALN